MTAAAADSVALAVDGVDKPDRLPQRNIVPHRLYGLAARLLARSNAVYDKVDYRDSGSFSEVGATRHAGWNP